MNYNKIMIVAIKGKDINFESPEDNFKMKHITKSGKNTLWSTSTFSWITPNGNQFFCG